MSSEYEGEYAAFVDFTRNMDSFVQFSAHLLGKGKTDMQTQTGTAVQSAIQHIANKGGIIEI